MEPWEIMISGVAGADGRRSSRPQRLAEVEAVLRRAGSCHCTVIGEVTDDGRAARAAGTARSSARSRPASSPTTARATRSTPSAASRLAEPSRAERRAGGRRPRDLLLDLLGRAEHLRQGVGLRAATTSSSARAPCAGPGSTRRVLRLTPVLPRPRGLARRHGRARRARPAPRRRRSRCSRRRATSPAPAASRSAITDCLNFGNPEKPRDRVGAARGDRGDGAGLRGARHPGRLGQRLALQRDRRPPIHPTPVVGCVGLARATCAAVPRRAGASGDVVLLAAAARRSARRLRVPGALTARSPGASAELDLGAEAALCSRSSRATAAAAALGARRLRRRPRGRARRGRRSRAGLGVDARAAAPTPRDARSARAAARSCSLRARRRGASTAARRGVPLRRIGAGRRRSRSLRRARSTCRSPTRARLRPCRGDGAADVRRLRHPLARARRRAARLLRALRAAAPRPGVGRDRRLRRRPPDRRCATWGSSRRSSTRSKLQALPGEVAIGHTRYSTTGSAHWSNAQPLVAPPARPHRRARPQRQPDEHDRAARRARREQGVRLGSTSDTEVIAALIAHDPAPARRGRRARDGAASRARTPRSSLDEDTLLAFRDPHGIRPLVLGRPRRRLGGRLGDAARSTSSAPPSTRERAARRAA